MTIPVWLSSVASALVVNKESKVLLLRRSHTAKFGRGLWQFPEGKTKLFEKPDVALARELAEEIGSAPGIQKKLAVFKFKAKFPLFNASISRHVYIVSVPEKVILSYEHDDYGWFEMKEALKLKLMPGIGKIIRGHI